MRLAGNQPGLFIGAETTSRHEELSAASRLRFSPHRAVIIGALALAFALLSLPAYGQSTPEPRPSPLVPPPSTSNPDGFPTASMPDDPISGSLWGPTIVPFGMMPVDTTWLMAAESCNSWTESSAHSPTVSVARLDVPKKASSEYQKGCSAFKDKRLGNAEEHERNAVRLYPQYAAAWVVLGQILEAENKRDDGRMACSQARSVDPNYVAPYLCLADFAAIEDNWKEVSILSVSALSLDPTGNAYSFFYAGDAAFHLGDLANAEHDAQNSIKLDKWHHLARVHLLMAQIYKAKQDFIKQAAELREYLKIAPNSADTPGIKTTLAQLEAKNSQ
jgi:tetratricopeptide (TPR) repeat protein